jgi:hypothetical protein
MPQTKCTDFFEMCNSVLEYVKKHGGNILLNDVPTRREVGYVTDNDNYPSDPWWVIDIKDLRESISNGTIPREDLDRLSLVVREVNGRARIGWALAEGYLPWTDWDRFEKSRPKGT